VRCATGETGCCLRRPRREAMKKRIGAASLVDSWQSVLYWNLEGKTWARETEEAPLLVSVTRNRLLKTLQAEKTYLW
jgi:hypothetical protein